MKRFLTLFFAVVLVASCFATAVSAAKIEDPIVQPYYVGIKDVARTISISGGTASCYSSVSTRDLTYKISYTMYLQRLDSTWTNVASWPVSGTYRVSKDGSASVDSGKYYRTKIVGNIYDSNWNLIESFDEESNIVRCS